MENEFLQKINLERLQQETGLSLQGIADLADVSVQTVYRWSWEKGKQGNRPSFNAIVRLLEHGATVETLFGVDYAKTHQSDKPEPAADRKPLDLDSPEFQAAVKSAIVDLKTKGLI